MVDLFKNNLICYFKYKKIHISCVFSVEQRLFMICQNGISNCTRFVLLFFRLTKRFSAENEPAKCVVLNNFKKIDVNKITSKDLQKSMVALKLLDCTTKVFHTSQWKDKRSVMILNLRYSTSI